MRGIVYRKQFNNGDVSSALNRDWGVANLYNLADQYGAILAVLLGGLRQSLAGVCYSSASSGLQYVSCFLSDAPAGSGLRQQLGFPARRRGNHGQQFGTADAAQI